MFGGHLLKNFAAEADEGTSLRLCGVYIVLMGLTQIIFELD